jgi:hypothetical protein
MDFNGASGPSLGLLKNLDLASGLAADEAILLSGDPANPVALSGISEVNLSGTIPENMVYRLSGSPSAVHTLMDTRKDPFFYPNPTTGEVRTNRKMTDEIRSPIQVYNMNGQRVFMASDVNHLNLVGNPTGLYELRFQTDKGWRTERMCVVPE